MKNFIIAILMLIGYAAKAQIKADTIMIDGQVLFKSCNGYSTGGHSMGSSITNKQSEHVGDSGITYMWNYKNVPMGYYCDTSIRSSGYRNMDDITVTIFFDRVVLFQVRFIQNKDLYWSVYSYKKLLQSFCRKSTATQ